MGNVSIDDFYKIIGELYTKAYFENISYQSKISFLDSQNKKLTEDNGRLLAELNHIKSLSKNDQ